MSSSEYLVSRSFAFKATHASKRETRRCAPSKTSPLWMKLPFFGGRDFHFDLIFVHHLFTCSQLAMGSLPWCNGVSLRHFGDLARVGHSKWHGARLELPLKPSALFRVAIGFVDPPKCAAKMPASTHQAFSSHALFRFPPGLGSPTVRF